MENDSDGDGKISREELPEGMQRRFDFMDANADGFLDESDMAELRDRFRDRRRSGGPGRGGPGRRGPGGRGAPRPQR